MGVIGAIRCNMENENERYGPLYTAQNTPPSQLSKSQLIVIFVLHREPHYTGTPH